MPVSASQHHHPPSCVTCSLLAPCRRALTRLFRVPASAALSIRAFRFRSLRSAAARMSPQRRRRRRRLTTFRSVRAVFWPLVPAPSSTAPAAADEDAARRSSTTELLAAAQEAPAPVPSPETPAYVKVVARLRSGRSAASGDAGDDDEEDREEKEAACRSFESCLMEMLVEEGKARDLQDVEELLRCWDRLKSPVFVDLVCRFYGELCNDMFPANADDDDDDDAGYRDDVGDAPAASTSSA